MTSFDRLVIGCIISLIALNGAVLVHDRLRRVVAANRPPQIVFISEDEQGIFQLNTVDPQQAQTEYLTDGTRDVIDYDIAPAGDQIAFSLSDSDGSHDLYLLDLTRRNTRLVVECVDASCTQPVWSPNGERLVYERRNLPAPQAPPGPPRLWWLELDSRETAPVFDDSQQLGFGASFSSDGEWLAMVVPLREEIMSINLRTGSAVTLDSSTGESPVWGPDNTLFFTEIDLRGEVLAVHLFQADLQTGEVKDLTGEDTLFNDGSIQWHAQSNRLVFTRKPARTAAGKQVWLVDDDGQNPVSITDDIEIHNGLPQWSPDGRFLAVQRFQITEPYAEPEIWLLDLENGTERLIIKPGSRPSWIP